MGARGGRRRFLRSFLASPRQVGAVLPTSAHTVRATLSLAAFEQARCVVEIGAGTGVYTRGILDRIPSDSRLLAFEIDPNLSRALEADIPDSRLSVINDSASEMSRHLDGERPDCIVSAVPFTSLPDDVGREILVACRDALAPGGTMLVLQYSPLVERKLRDTFSSVERTLSVLNVPPAFLYACRTSVDGAVLQG